VSDWRAFLNSGLTVEELQLLRQHERTGRPLRSEAFIQRMEEAVGRVLRRLKPGRKPGEKAN
jgi:putative transposase